MDSSHNITPSTTYPTATKLYCYSSEPYNKYPQKLLNFIKFSSISLQSINFNQKNIAFNPSFLDSRIIYFQVLKKSNKICQETNGFSQNESSSSPLKIYLRMATNYTYMYVITLENLPINVPIDFKLSFEQKNAYGKLKLFYQIDAFKNANTPGTRLPGGLNNLTTTQFKNHCENIKWVKLGQFSTEPLSDSFKDTYRDSESSSVVNHHILTNKNQHTLFCKNHTSVYSRIPKNNLIDNQIDRFALDLEAGQEYHVELLVNKKSFGGLFANDRSLSSGMKRSRQMSERLTQRPS